METNPSPCTNLTCLMFLIVMIWSGRTLYLREIATRNQLIILCIDHLLYAFSGHDTKQVKHKVGIHRYRSRSGSWGQIRVKQDPKFWEDGIKRNARVFTKRNGIAKIIINVMYASTKSKILDLMKLLTNYMLNKRTKKSYN